MVSTVSGHIDVVIKRGKMGGGGSPCGRVFILEFCMDMESDILALFTTKIKEIKNKEDKIHGVTE
jgi:hypothetical protein